MSRRKVRIYKKASLGLTAGVIFGGLSCVTSGADIVGTGLTLTAATGILGPATQGTTAVGAGLDLFADFVKYAPHIGG